jgi:hypothetical protein
VAEYLRVFSHVGFFVLAHELMEIMRDIGKGPDASNEFKVSVEKK